MSAMSMCVPSGDQRRAVSLLSIRWAPETGEEGSSYLAFRRDEVVAGDTRKDTW